MNSQRCNCIRAIIDRGGRSFGPDNYGASVQRCNVHGDPGLPSCNACGGKGDVYGVNRDDPPFWNCVPCGGSGVARKAA